MKLFKHNNYYPQIHKNTFIFSGTRIIGDVTIAKKVSIWYNTVIRADMSDVKIGSMTNIQDGSVIHVDTNYPTHIGENVTIGHNAVVHGCTVADNCLIAMSTTLLNGCKIGESAIVAAGALVLENFIVPPRTLVAGVPAKIIREVRDEEVAYIIKSAENYYENAKQQIEDRR